MRRIALALVSLSAVLVILACADSGARTPAEPHAPQLDASAPPADRPAAATVVVNVDMTSDAGPLQIIITNGSILWVERALIVYFPGYDGTNGLLIDAGITAAEINRRIIARARDELEAVTDLPKSVQWILIGGAQ